MNRIIFIFIFLSSNIYTNHQQSHFILCKARQLSVALLSLRNFPEDESTLLSWEHTLKSGIAEQRVIRKEHPEVFAHKTEIITKWNHLYLGLEQKRQLLLFSREARRTSEQTEDELPCLIS